MLPSVPGCQICPPVKRCVWHWLNGAACPDTYEGAFSFLRRNAASGAPFLCKDVVLPLCHKYVEACILDLCHWGWGASKTCLVLLQSVERGRISVSDIKDFTGSLPLCVTRWIMGVIARELSFQSFIKQTRCQGYMFEFCSCGSGDNLMVILYLELLLFISSKILNVKMFNAQSVNAKYALKVLFFGLNSFSRKELPLDCFDKLAKHLNLEFFFSWGFFFRVLFLGVLIFFQFPYSLQVFQCLLTLITALPVLLLAELLQVMIDPASSKTVTAVTVI